MLHCTVILVRVCTMIGRVTQMLKTLKKIAYSSSNNQAIAGRNNKNIKKQTIKQINTNSKRRQKK